MGVHVIFEHKGKNHLIKKDIRCKDDVFTHLYTLILNTDGSYEVLIDNEKAESGTLTDDWDFLPPKKIKDPEAKKPADWVDNAKMDDPEDSKPEDWDKPEHIADPDATKPEDWDEEKFDTLDAWVQSTHKGAEAGKFELSAGKFYGDEKLDQGAKTSQDARFYGMSAAFPPMSNVDKPLVIQFTVKHVQNIDCGGGYIKLFDCKLDQADMHGESPYNIMFGPDICGSGTKKVHVIFEHKGKNHLIKKDIRCKDD